MLIGGGEEEQEGADSFQKSKKDERMGDGKVIKNITTYVRDSEFAIEIQQTIVAQ
jgi:hypothetical protein